MEIVARREFRVSFDLSACLICILVLHWTERIESFRIRILLSVLSCLVLSCLQRRDRERSVEASNY